MRKYLLALAAGLLAASLAVPATAADFKYTGIFRIRGITADDMDRNKNSHDGTQYYDVLVRPRFTATSEGGKIVAIYELDYSDGNHVFGSTTADTTVAVNRWWIDFAIPGTTLRMRVGREDWVDPTREIFDSIGTHRQDGIGIYGKLFGPVEISAFTTKLDENGQGAAAADDADNYYLALKWQAAPQIAITPWVGLSRQNTNNATATTGFEMWYLALHAQAKVGILDLQVQGILQTGNAAEPTQARRLAGDRDVDLEAWALQVRSWLTFGKAKVGLYFTYLSGDDDQVSATTNTAQQPDRTLSRFVFPTSSGYLNAPNLLTGQRFSTVVNTVPGRSGLGNRTGTGSGSNAQLNGVVIPEILGEYQLTPDLKLEGGVSFVRSAKKAPDRGTAATTFNNEKNFGTIFEAGFRWNIYKQLALWVQGSYLAAGDYGKVQGGKANDDAWAVYYEFRHTW
jgi:hypothetical protein